MCDQFFKIVRLLLRLEIGVLNFGNVARHFDGLLAFTESRLPFHSFFAVIEIAEDKEQLKLNFISENARTAAPTRQ